MKISDVKVDKVIKVGGYSVSSYALATAVIEVLDPNVFYIADSDIQSATFLMAVTVNILAYLVEQIVKAKTDGA